MSKDFKSSIHYFCPTLTSAHFGVWARLVVAAYAPLQGYPCLSMKISGVTGRLGAVPSIG
jgi:hypothetical protein